MMNPDAFIAANRTTSGQLLGSAPTVWFHTTRPDGAEHVVEIAEWACERFERQRTKRGYRCQRISCAEAVAFRARRGS